MVEEYMDLVAMDSDVEDIDVEELNGWIEHEMSTFQQGYRDWGDENSWGNRRNTRDTEPATIKWYSKNRERWQIVGVYSTTTPTTF